MATGALSWSAYTCGGDAILDFSHPRDGNEMVVSDWRSLTA